MLVKEGVGVSPALSSLRPKDEGVKGVDFAGVIAGLYRDVEVQEGLFEAARVVDERICRAHGSENRGKGALEALKVFKDQKWVGQA